jgi:hypothetical protein
MKPLIILISCLVAFSTTIFAAEPSTIKVQVQLTVPDEVKIFAVGFSVGNKSRGSLGRMTTKTGPAGGSYAFGLKTDSGLKVSCGAAKLVQNSIVKLIYDGTQCKINRIVAMQE